MGKDILSKAQLEANLTELDSVLQKSQIVQGGNSSRQSWAGSEFEKVSPPNNTPNGTDYVPPKTIAHKAISEMSDAEIEHYMEMRKAGVANPIAAEQEILSTVADVAKAQCPVCEGTQISKSNFNEPCEHCNGFGYVWLCKSEQAQEQIEEIEKKWNVDKIGKGGGPQAKNKGGGRGAADTTPPSGRPYRKEALDDTGEDVAGEDTDIENPGVSKSVRDTMREMSYMDTALNKATDDEDMELEEEDEEDEEDVEKCAKKALETEMIFRSFQTLNRSQGTLLQEVTSLRKSVAILQGMLDQQFDVIHALAKSQSTIGKSLLSDISTNTGNADRFRRVPARSPRAVTNGGDVKIIQKSWADAAPEGRTVGESSSGNARYSKKQLQAGVWDMIQKSLVDRRVGLRLDANAALEEELLARIEKHLDTNPSLLQ